MSIIHKPKKVLSVFLAICLILSIIPMTGMSVDAADNDFTLYYRDGKMYDAASGGNEVITGYTGTYSASSDGMTLTLNNFKFSTSKEIAFVLSTNLTVNLIGTSTVESTSSQNTIDTSGLYISNQSGNQITITFKGNGTLQGKAGEITSGAKYACGIRCMGSRFGIVVEDGAILEGFAGKTAGTSYGVALGNAGLNIDSGTVRGTCFSKSAGVNIGVSIGGGTDAPVIIKNGLLEGISAPSGSASTGISIGSTVNQLTVESGGKVIGTGVESRDSSSANGLQTSGNITVNSGGELTGNGGNATSSDTGKSCGISVSGSLTVNGGIIQGFGGATDGGESIGIQGGYSSDSAKINILGGTVTGTAGTSISGTCYGIYTQAADVIPVLGSDMKATGGASSSNSNPLIFDSQTYKVGDAAGAIAEYVKIAKGTSSGNKPTPSVTVTPDSSADSTYNINVPSTFEGKNNKVTVTAPEGNTSHSLAPIIIEPADRAGEYLPKSILDDETVVFLVDETMKVKIVDNSKDFNDVKDSDWFSDNIDFVSARELFNGTSETNFSPSGPLTRGMFATVLWRLELTPNATGTQFGDIGSDAYYADAAVWGASAGIIEGIGNNQFAPSRNITRQDLVLMMYRYAEYIGIGVSGNADLSNYIDGDTVSGYAEGAMKWAVDVGLITGSGDSINPKGTATRAQASAILQRFVVYLLGNS